MSTVITHRFRVPRLFVWLGKTFLKLTGWRVEVEGPLGPKWVGVVAPHTSNWDFIYVIAMSFVLDLPVHWVGKHTLFWGPCGWILRRLGGIPVDRRAKQNIVDTVVQAFGERDEFVVGIAPEGTRSYTDHWKTGFYRIADGAGVPIHLFKFDYARKTGIIGPQFDPTGDLESDMKRISDYYADAVPKHPKKKSEIKA
jgi:1-acyl-sn-glycerol-3-phosphate acyltransferase